MVRSPCDDLGVPRSGPDSSTLPPPRAPTRGCGDQAAVSGVVIAELTKFVNRVKVGGTHTASRSLVEAMKTPPRDVPRRSDAGIIVGIISTSRPGKNTNEKPQTENRRSDFEMHLGRSIKLVLMRLEPNNAPTGSQEQPDNARLGPKSTPTKPDRVPRGVRTSQKR
ncbi:hypothetical protein Bbelb_252620 [Branchiostoma belcheri]|nr:hypothetical protein Bbelb_252620 [Branchiostoma belcheri]